MKIREQQAVHTLPRRTTEDHVFPQLPNSTRRFKPIQPDTKPELELDIHDVSRAPYGERIRVPVPTPRRSLISSPLVPRKTIRPNTISLYHPHWSLILLSGMGVMWALSVGMGWIEDRWSGIQQDWKYGNPRTYQVDQKVGHNDEYTPSHFIALNLNKQVMVVEFPGGKADQAKVYVGPVLQGEGKEKTPVTIHFQDVNADGKVDLVGTAGTVHFVFINEGKQFRSPEADDQINL